MSINKIFLLGFLGKKPEMRATPSGQYVCKFSLATSDYYTDKQGNKKDTTTWHNIVCFSKLAELCGEYLDKGSKVFIEGKLQNRSWEDKSGQKRYITEVLATSLQFLDSKKQSSTKEEVKENIDQPEVADEWIPF